MRKLYASRETSLLAKGSKGNVVRVIGFFPVDRGDCNCISLIAEWKKRLSQANEKEQIALREKTPYIVCPRDKKGMTRYKVLCTKCKQMQGFCYATDETLTDWCDFHYVQWTKGDYWRGCFTPHISPVTEQLCFECCCGNDSRDFRANATLPQKVAERMERVNSVGRNFGLNDSKFIAKRVTKIVLL